MRQTQVGFSLELIPESCVFLLEDTCVALCICLSLTRVWLSNLIINRSQHHHRFACAQYLLLVQMTFFHFFILHPKRLLQVPNTNAHDRNVIGFDIINEAACLSYYNMKFIRVFRCSIFQISYSIDDIVRL